MKKLLVVIATLALTGFAMAADNIWMTDMEKAMEQSSESGKPILVNFTGSDWCGWCIKLDKEVFSKQAFKDYAKENLVLVVVDFPRNIKQSAALRKQNKELMRKYSIKGFPTILLLNQRGKVLATTGYKSGGPEKYISHLKELIARSEKK